jgi:hypothetical protein
MQFDPMTQHSAAHMGYRSIIEHEHRAQRPPDRAAEAQPRRVPPARWSVRVWTLLRMIILRRRLRGADTP